MEHAKLRNAAILQMDLMNNGAILHSRPTKTRCKKKPPMNRDKVKAARKQSRNRK